MKLVAINSINELRFVKQLLRRETQYTRDRPSVVINSLQKSTSFLAHIGNMIMSLKHDVQRLS